MLGTLSHPETGIPGILSLQRYTQHSQVLNFLMLRFLPGISIWHLYYYFNFSSYLNKLVPNCEAAQHQWFPAVCQTCSKAECRTGMEILRWSVVEVIMPKRVSFTSHNLISRTKPKIIQLRTLVCKLTSTHFKLMQKTECSVAGKTTVVYCKTW